MLSKFSDNLRMFQGNGKRQIAEDVYIIEGKNTGWLPVCFLKVAKSFLKKYIDI